MTLQQLLENAHLDALGQLDEREQAAYEAAFAVAPPGVQAQIRREQARVAGMDDLLPRVEAPAYLRERVLNAVSAAMLAESAGVLSGNSLESGLGAGLAMRSPRRVHTGWRMASIGLMTAAVVLGAAFVNVYMTNQEMTTRFENDTVASAYLKTFEREHMQDVLYSVSTNRVLFDAAEGFNGQGSLWVSPDWESSRMFVTLPLANVNYRLVVLDDNDQEIESVATLGTGGQQSVLTMRRFAPGTKLAVVTTAQGTALTEGHLLMVAVV